MKNKNPLVSFIITAFNTEQFAEECIYSCLRQSYNNIEVVIVNDGSTDKTYDILHNTFSTHPNVKIINFQSNKGKIEGFSEAFKHSSGEYIALMCADDICYPDRIELSLKSLNEHYNAICTDLDKLDVLGNVIERAIYKKTFPNIEANSFSTKNLIEKPKVFGGTFFIKRSIANKIFPLPGFLSHEDWYIPIIASLHTKIHYINKPLIGYRMHDNNNSANNARYYPASYKKWKYIKTRNIGYHEFIKIFVKEHNIDTNLDNINLILIKSRILKETNKVAFYLRHIGKVNSFREKLAFTLLLFPFAAYLVFFIRTFLRNNLKRDKFK